MVTKGRMAAWAIASVIPLAVVAFGILLFINGVLLTRDFIIAVFVVPAIAILLLADSIFSKKGGGVIRTISAICSLLLFLLASDIGVALCALDCIIRIAEVAAAVAVETLGLLEQTFTTLAGRNCISNSRHFSTPSLN